MKLAEQFPELRMVGHFDKMTMDRGEAAMRAEFERLRPVDRLGRFHSERRSPNAARRFDEFLPKYSAACWMNTRPCEAKFRGHTPCAVCPRQTAHFGVCLDTVRPTRERYISHGASNLLCVWR